MLRGRKILSTEITKKEPVKIGEVVPVITSSLAGTGVKVQPVITNTVTGQKPEKMANGVTPAVGSKKPATLFMIIMLVLGFYVIYDQFIDEDKYSEVVSEETELAAKIDETKDYVYYENEEEILTSSSSNKYTYKDIVININSDSINSLTTRLKAENGIFAKNFENDETETYECLTTASVYNSETSYAGQFTFRDYQSYDSNGYLTVVIVDKNVDRCGNVLNKTITTYVIDKKEGIIYTENSLLTLYNTTKENLITKAVEGRKDGLYATLTPDVIVSSILELDDIQLYIDSKECLGVYYTGIMYETIEDKNNLSIICK